MAYASDTEFSYRLTINLLSSTGAAIDALASATSQTKVSVIRGLLDEAAPNLLRLAHVVNDAKKNGMPSDQALLSLLLGAQKSVSVVSDGVEALRGRPLSD
ncbi:MAG: hypothetical protein ACYDDR_14175 [Acidithiobacillus ferrivorans]